tara:strand:+ start:3249 stop:3896 length:648 start_codon:yes stop_codon:yes gene_type:complete
MKNQITYKNFSREKTIDHFQDHQDIIKQYNINSVIEFGVGEGTNVFLKNCTGKITSVELLTTDYPLAELLKISTDEWVNYSINEFKKYDNWNAVKYEVQSSILDAEYDVTGKGNKGVIRGNSPSSMDYIQELTNLINTLNISEYDMAFVDPGIHLRGDIVNLLFDKVNIITAHDFNIQPIYGYNRINIPPTYEGYSGNHSMEGLGVFIKKTINKE